RNHDELTLEMVTNDERDYMYLAYSADPRMRINLGIRRRLAPLMDNNRNRIELLNSLLLSFPGTPIIYYGDEIGMGDNIYLGDRNGVRTPMQWSADRNAGFSRATPARLFSPVVMDPVWGYEAVNVEAEQSDPSSLLNWMRNMIALRKLFQVFGRGTLEFLNPSNRKVLAYLRRYEGEQILCVANLSRFAQPVDLDLSELEGMVPVEMLGYVEFPPIARQPYRLTLGAYGFLWLELHGVPERTEMEADPEGAALAVGAGWATLFEGAARHRFVSTVLPEYLPKQRWFGGKSRRIQQTEILDWASPGHPNSSLALVEVRYDSGAPDTYFIPLAMALGKTADNLREASPNAILASIITADGPGVLHDGVFDNEECADLLALIEQHSELHTRRGTIRGTPGAELPAVTGQDGALQVRRGSAEQSNSSVVYGDRLIMKLFRRYQEGPNPECEIERYLTEQAHFDRVPPFVGTIDYVRQDGGTATLGMLQGLVANEGDGWKWTVEEIERYYEHCATVPFPEENLKSTGGLIDVSEQPTSQLAKDYVGFYLESAATLGRRTAELHRALASASSDPAFAPEPFTPQDIEALRTGWRDQALHAFEVLKASVSKLPDDLVEYAGLILGRRREMLERFRASGSEGTTYGLRTRIHGDYHLGQVLRVKTDYVILDFEGEPARSLPERRAKHSPLKDVAGMLRSFSYAAIATLLNYTTRRPEDLTQLEPWAQLWERSTSAEFLRAYREAAGDAGFLPQGDQEFRGLLSGYLLEKAFYELSYELNSRPAWVRIPLVGILSLSL
ncbi:MAG: putative maltokinase, partial [Bryobacteraceae bacterium]